MPQRPDTMPDVVFIGPPKRRVKHKYVLFSVIERTQDSNPLMLRLVREDEQVDVTVEKDFITGYIPEVNLKKR